MLKQQQLATSHLISLLSNNLPRQKLREAGRKQRENCTSHLYSSWDVNAIVVLLSDTPVETAKRANPGLGEVRLREEINSELDLTTNNMAPNHSPW
jgi:hypothetical protein